MFNLRNKLNEAAASVITVDTNKSKHKNNGKKDKNSSMESFKRKKNIKKKNNLSIKKKKNQRVRKITRNKMVAIKISNFKQ